MDRTEHFQTGGEAYARHRPSYPADLGAYLAGLCDRRTLALDIGCGSGQFSHLLANHFTQVIASDVSADQLAHAEPRDNIRYELGTAEHCDRLTSEKADLIVAAQAAHWFDLGAFYAAAQRLAQDRTILALITYGKAQLRAQCAALFDDFYGGQMAPYWPSERALVDGGYRDLPFPFAEIKPQNMEIRRRWTRDQFLAYVETWSATKLARSQGRGDIPDRFADDLTTAWPDAETEKTIIWPIAMRIGMITP